ncbi:putative outer membrane protein B [Methylobacterium sp. 4-46]|uniref:right-handed parallel beta-helix repeat-containing protein n=1 Tax=unclassified Methylobacterium TaxID=2615210 RepID=UPI000152D412|nr:MULTISPECIES: right-handed parallel beta-helix repeat-containing protein [Methylobacterium]ACA20358.1 putative outer membrane protein B [Methylobacterium sp. 4-46]WFT79529.1 right-handed parallel beta-helix repeat-containing protein [Methylobacterium nodulans]
MRKSALPTFIACVAGFILCQATHANAQATRTWVSGVGDDANPCSRTAPCKTFAGAISKTANDGIISVLDPGGFGSVTITKSITIRGRGAEAGVLASGVQGVVVNAPNATVSLVGLSIDGAGTGTRGINVISAAQVTIKDCEISRFTDAGIYVSSSSNSRVMVKDSMVHSNARGVVAIGTNATLAGVVLDNVVVDASSTANLVADQAGGIIALRRSTVLGAPILNTNGATIRSYGDNALNGGTPNSVTPLQ